MRMDIPLEPPPSTSSAANAKQKPGPAVPATPEERSTAFKPVTNAPEMQSGEKLLVEAYAAIWIILFAMVLLSWRRQRKIEARIDELDAAVSKAREHSGGEGGA